MEHSHGMIKTWWKPDRCGYTEDVDKAGLYDEAAAREICEKAGPEHEQMWSELQVATGKAGRVKRVVYHE